MKFLHCVRKSNLLHPFTLPNVHTQTTISFIIVNYSLRASRTSRGNSKWRFFSTERMSLWICIIQREIKRKAKHSFYCQEYLKERKDSTNVPHTRIYTIHTQITTNTKQYCRGRMGKIKITSIMIKIMHINDCIISMDNTLYRFCSWITAHVWPAPSLYCSQLFT